MKERFAKLILVGAAVILPTMAHAGTSSASGTASLRVVNQCTVSGVNINLGTFKAADTWADVMAVHGSTDIDGNYFPGSAGDRSLTWGSVTCDAGVPYTVKMSGRSSIGLSMVQFDVNGKKMYAWQMIKEIDGATVPDTYYLIGAGLWGSDGANGIGTGAPQLIKGNLVLDPTMSVAPDAATAADSLATAGSYVAGLDYVLTF